MLLLRLLSMRARISVARGGTQEANPGELNCWNNSPTHEFATGFASRLRNSASAVTTVPCHCGSLPAGCSLAGRPLHSPHSTVHCTPIQPSDYSLSMCQAASLASQSDHQMQAVAWPKMATRNCCQAPLGIHPGLECKIQRNENRTRA